MSEPLDPAVTAALACAGLRVRSFCCISNIRSPQTGRTVYRIELASGDMIKARRLQDEESARRLFEIRRELPAAFAPAFARYGAVLLENWIEGQALGSSTPSEAHLVRAASLLAHLHAMPAAGTRPTHEMRSTADWIEPAEDALRLILDAGAVDQRAAVRLRRALERLDPKHATCGVVHLDFCGENMVIDRAGQLRVVDNERIRIDALGFDLARTWYRWPLPPVAWERFRSAYAARMPLAEPIETLTFWSIVAVLRSAALRLRIDRARAGVPLGRLRDIARQLGAPPARCPEPRPPCQH